MVFASDEKRKKAIDPGNYLFRFPNGRRLFYALDTGYYAEETWAYLEDRKTDILILKEEC